MKSEDTNQHFKHQLETSASASAIWSLWLDVSRWGEWDKGLRSGSATEPLVLGATGTITDHSGRTLPFTVDEFVEGKSYMFRTRLPFGSLAVRRTILRTTPCLFEHEVAFTGPGGWVLSHFLGPSFRKKIGATMEGLAAIATGIQPRDATKGAA
jgi:hypothetical protein